MEGKNSCITREQNSAPFGQQSVALITAPSGHSASHILLYSVPIGGSIRQFAFDVCNQLQFQFGLEISYFYQQIG
jgi:hypothetical protein